MQQDKAKRQSLYRQMLLNQQNEKKNMYGVQGNMTQVEKWLNKEDLKAYKKYDNTHYSMIPGIEGRKNFFDRNQLKNKGGTSFNEQQNRLQRAGFGWFQTQSFNNSFVESWPYATLAKPQNVNQSYL